MSWWTPPHMFVVAQVKRAYFGHHSSFLFFIIPSPNIKCLSPLQSKTVLCPMSGHPIKMNELITVRFTPLDPSLDRLALLTRQVSHPTDNISWLKSNSPTLQIKPQGQRPL